MTVSPTVELRPTPSSQPSDSKQRVGEFLKSLQDSICQKLEQVDGGAQFK